METRRSPDEEDFIPARGADVKREGKERPSCALPHGSVPKRQRKMEKQGVSCEVRPRPIARSTETIVNSQEDK